MWVCWRLLFVRGIIARGEASAEEEESYQCGKDCKRDNLQDDSSDGCVASKLELTEIALGASGQSSTNSYSIAD